MRKKKVELCDRCGNDFGGGTWMIHLPYKKEYIKFCHICIRGLMLDFYFGVVRDIRANHLCPRPSPDSVVEVAREVKKVFEEK